MSKQVRFRRGTTAQHSVFTGPAGEITVNTDKKALVVHDGVTAGGVTVARADRQRGWSRTEIFTANGTWSQSGKTDLKRIIVYAYGGGGGGSTAGGGQGGVGMVILEASAITTTVAVTVGAGSTGTGGTTSFGSYLSCTGGAAASSTTAGSGGGVSGAGAFNLGAQGGSTAPLNPTSSSHGGGEGSSTAVRGVFGSGGVGATGGPGCVIIEEIYGFV